MSLFPIFMPGGFALAEPTPLDTDASTSDLTTYTFNNINIGAPGFIIVVVHFGVAGASLRTISSATIGGVAANIAVQVNQNDTIYRAAVGIVTAMVNSAGPITVSITLSGGSLGMDIEVYRLDDPVSTTPFHTATDNTLSAGAVSVALNIPQGGFAIAAFTTCGCDDEHLWSGLTEDNYVESSAGMEFGRHGVAIGFPMNAETGRAISVTLGTGSETQALVAASWR